jgi:hypothetical protein
VNTATRIGLYSLALAVVFAGAFGAGRLTGLEPAPAAHGAEPGHPGGHESAAAVAEPPGGLQISEAGYRLAPAPTALTPGRPSPFRFQVLGADGHPVTRYTPTHERDLHLIVVRRDLSDFQHVHPAMAGDGTWSIPLTVAAAGQYRLIADFQPAGRDGGLVLGTDLPVAGPYAPRPLPAAAKVSDVDRYRVELTGEVAPGRASRLAFRISRDGAPVTDLQPYLGAYGHLVALREGDLAYLHVHPDGADPAGVAFVAEVPGPGTYRLYLDFRHGDVVRTAEFTVTALP